MPPSLDATEKQPLLGADAAAAATDAPAVRCSPAVQRLGALLRWAARITLVGLCVGLVTLLLPLASGSARAPYGGWHAPPPPPSTPLACHVLPDAGTLNVSVVVHEPWARLVTHHSLRGSALSLRRDDAGADALAHTAGRRVPPGPPPHGPVTLLLTVTRRARAADAEREAEALKICSFGFFSGPATGIFPASTNISDISGKLRPPPLKAPHDDERFGRIYPEISLAIHAPTSLPLAILPDLPPPPPPPPPHHGGRHGPPHGPPPPGPPPHGPPHRRPDGRPPPPPRWPPHGPPHRGPEGPPPPPPPSMQD